MRKERRSQGCPKLFKRLALSHVQLADSSHPYGAAFAQLKSAATNGAAWLVNTAATVLLCAVHSTRGAPAHGGFGNNSSRPGDLVVLEASPQLELVLPLVHADTVGHQAQHALLDAGGGCHPHQGLARPTWQHYDACTHGVATSQMLQQIVAKQHAANCSTVIHTVSGLRLARLGWPHLAA